MIGKQIRLQRLFNGNLTSENILIFAVDHGMFQGVQPGLEDEGKVLSTTANADAIILGPGMISHYPQAFFTRTGPACITRLGFTSAYCFPWNYSQGHTTEMFTPEYLHSLGADAIVTSLQLRTGSEKTDALNAEIWGKVVMAKERLGLPLIGEFHPTIYENVEKDEWHNLIKTGCRILCELGADMIKTFYTDERFSEITESVPVPIVILGSKKLPKDIDALKLAENAVSNGARGLAFGRNIFQADNPSKMIDALKLVAKQGKTAEQAAMTLAD